MSANRTLKELYPDLNKNVKLVLLFSVLNSFGRGIWFGNVLSAYIYFLANESNAKLGLVSSASGLALTLVVFPAGYASDRYRRDRILWGAAAFGLIALIIAGFATDLIMIAIALVFWGITNGMARPALEAIFADSVETGARSQIYAIKHFCQQAGMAIGPFLNIFLFYYLGDVWDLGILRTVIFVGLVISGLSFIPLLAMNDDSSIGDDSEALIISDNGNDDSHSISQSKIPYLLITANIIVGMGAGMTVKFFPIFFLDVYDLSPVPVNALLGFVFIFTGLSSVTAQKFSLRQGRAKMIFIVQASATLCLFTLAFYPPLIIMVPIFLARGSLMNSAQPLSRSILMDHIPKSKRGRWNSIEAIAWGLFWNVSAVFGGYLIEAYSYRVCFLITASIYTIGTIPILIIIPLVAREKGAITERSILQKHDASPSVVTGE